MTPWEAAQSAARVAFGAADPPTAARLRRALDAVHTVLVAAGELHAAPPPMTAEDAARLLADASGFPRYTDGDGWRLLLECERDVDLAVAKAAKRTMPGDDRRAREVATAQKTLTEWIINRRVEAHLDALTDDQTGGDQR